MTYQLYLGDCLDFMRGMDAGSVDLTVTSPPYDTLRIYGGHSFDFQGIAKELYRVTKNGGIVVWIVGDETVNGSESGTSFRQALFFKDVCGFNLHDTMIYQKNALAYPTFDKYYPSFEYMFILSKGKPLTVNLLTDRKNKQANKSISGNERQRDGSLTRMIGSVNGARIKEYGVRFNIWTYDTGTGHSSLDDYAFDHPAIFPEALARDHILSWSNSGDFIFDPFSGSGTTGKMAMQLGRNFIGCEIDPTYYAIAEKRISEAAAQPPLFTLDAPRIEYEQAAML